MLNFQERVPKHLLDYMKLMMEILQPARLQELEPTPVKIITAGRHVPPGLTGKLITKSKPHLHPHLHSPLILTIKWWLTVLQILK